MLGNGFHDTATTCGELEYYMLFVEDFSQTGRWAANHDGAGKGQHHTEFSSQAGQGNMITGE